MQSVFLAGVGMNRFGRFPEQNLKGLAKQPIADALRDAGLDRQDIQAVYFSNSMAGIVTGQESIRGQTVLSANGIDTIPVVNVENACASGSTAVNQAYLAIAGGAYDIVLVLGVEKLFHTDKCVSYRALAAATDIEISGPAGNSSTFLEESGKSISKYMQETGTSIEHVAKIAAKSRGHGAKNPLAQYQNANTVDEILASPVVTFPLTRLMCSPIGDGAAALVLCSEAFARKRGLCHVRIAASVLGSAGPLDSAKQMVTEGCAGRAYDIAGIDPADLSLVELHDTTAASELMLYEPLGLCPPGSAIEMIEEEAIWIGGRIPVNTSGGLLARGHPVGASGVAQLCEIYWQLRGQAGPRQVNDARIGLAHNAGGTINGQPAATCITILQI